MDSPSNWVNDVILFLNLAFLEGEKYLAKTLYAILFQLIIELGGINLTTF